MIQVQEGRPMVVKEEDIQLLKKLGLSGLQAKVYLTLLKTGKASANTVSTLSGTDRSDTYKTLLKLQNKGFISQTICFPRLYEAVPPHDAIEELLRRRKEKEHKFEKEVIMWLKKTKCNRKTHIKENGAHVILIPENRTNILRRKNAIENAQESIDVINTWTRHMQAEEYYAEVAKKALQRGVKIRLLIDKPIDTMHLAAVEAKKCACFEVRYLDFPPPALLSIYDKALVFLATSSTAPLEVQLLCL
jgi:sugar-specific transcriptional regulator TrmB